MLGFHSVILSGEVKVLGLVYQKEEMMQSVLLFSMDSYLELMIYLASQI